MGPRSGAPLFPADLRHRTRVSLATFSTRLKTFLFTESYPEIQIIWHLHVRVYTLSIVDLAVF